MAHTITTMLSRTISFSGFFSSDKYLNSINLDKQKRTVIIVATTKTCSILIPKYIRSMPLFCLFV